MYFRPLLVIIEDVLQFTYELNINDKIPKETVVTIMILYINAKVKVRSPDGDTDFFDIVAGVLQGDALAPYLFTICLDNVLRTSIGLMKEDGFTLKSIPSSSYT